MVEYIDIVKEIQDRIEIAKNIKNDINYCNYEIENSGIKNKEYMCEFKEHLTKFANSYDLLFKTSINDKFIEYKDDINNFLSYFDTELLMDIFELCNDTEIEELISNEIEKR